MTELLSGPSAPSDAELTTRVRGGDLAAYGELFERHVGAARRLARQLVRGPDVDDLVSDAFARTLVVLQGGGGPDVAFRAYLLTSVRRIHVDRIRAARRVHPSEDMSAYDPGVTFDDPAVAEFENGAAARAFRSLPERWQLVLWHLEVEGQRPADIAPLLGVSANSVSALAYRAREGLRQAFLTMHATDDNPPACRWVNEHLGGYVRNGLSRRDSAKVDAHLTDCRRCTAVYLELTEVNSNLAGIIGPLVLGAVASAYASAAGGSTALGVSALLGRVRDAFGAHTGAAAAGGSGAGTGGGAVAGGGGLLAGGAATGSGVLAVGGIAATAVALTTAAALVLGGGAPTGESSSAVADTEPAAAPSPRTGAVVPGDGDSGPARQRHGKEAADRGLDQPGSSEASTPARPASASSPEAVAGPAPVTHGQQRVDAGRVTGSIGAGRLAGSGAQNRAPAPGRQAPWPAVRQPTDAPGPPPYGSATPAVEDAVAPPAQKENDTSEGGSSTNTAGGGGGDGSTGSDAPTESRSPTAAPDQPPPGHDQDVSGGRPDRDNTGPSNDNGHHKGHEKGKGHAKGHGEGHGEGHGDGRGHDH